MRSIYWLRNDIRLHDNATLRQFCESSSDGLIVWCANSSFARAGERRRQFLIGSLLEFQAKMNEKGLPLLVFFDSVETVLPQLVRESGAGTVFVTTDPAPEEQIDEEQVASIPNLNLIRVEQGNLLNPTDLPFAAHETPEVFTQFRNVVEKTCRVRDPLPVPDSWPKAISLNEAMRRLPIDSSPEAVHPHITPGESAGLSRVDEYIWKKDRLRLYKETRNGMMEWDDSTKFSPWLAAGALSPRQVYFEIQRYEKAREKNESTYWLYLELLWRDYFRLIMRKKGARIFGRIPALNSKQSSDFLLWTQARTGDEFVDANMQELNQTGWMSNRGRQNVASYLAKERGVPWQYGARYFEEKLIDYDTANNWGNWAYLAGVGQDPRNRRFNTARQADTYDPQRFYRSMAER